MGILSECESLSEIMMFDFFLLNRNSADTSVEHCSIAVTELSGIDIVMMPKPEQPRATI